MNTLQLETAHLLRVVRATSRLRQRLGRCLTPYELGRFRLNYLAVDKLAARKPRRLYWGECP